MLRDTAAVNPDHTPAPRPRRTGLIAAIAAAAVVLVAATIAVTLAAARSPGPAPAAQQQTQTPPATAAAAATAATTSSAAPPAPAVLKMGAKADASKAVATAYAWKQPVAANAARPEQEGFEWGAADVEICSNVDSYFNHSSWRLTYADHTMIEPSSTGYRQFPQPDYPWGDQDITAGQCVRGWITYAVPAGKKPATVQYQPQGFRADWQVI